MTVEVEIDNDALEAAYFEGKNEEVRAAYRGEGSMPEERRRMHAMDALDRYHGMPSECVKSWKIVENTLVEEDHGDAQKAGTAEQSGG